MSKLMFILALVLLGGCSLVPDKITFGQVKTDTILALAEPADICEIKHDGAVEVFATVAPSSNAGSAAVKQQVNATYNCLGLIALPKSRFKQLREYWLSKQPAPPTGKGTAALWTEDGVTVTPAAQALALAGGTETVQRLVVEAGEPIEIATDAPLECALPDGTLGKQCCAGMLCVKKSVYDEMRKSPPVVEPAK